MSQLKWRVINSFVLHPANILAEYLMNLSFLISLVVESTALPVTHKAIQHHFPSTLAVVCKRVAGKSLFLHLLLGSSSFYFWTASSIHRFLSLPPSTCWGKLKKSSFLGSCEIAWEIREFFPQYNIYEKHRWPLTLPEVLLKVVSCLCFCFAIFSVTCLLFV